MQLTADFPASYVAYAEDWATEEPDIRVTAPGAGARELRVTVCPDGQESWVGAFAAPAPDWYFLSALLTTPDPDTLLVLERGTAFLGSVHSPRSFHPIDAADDFVRAVPLKMESLMLLVGHFRIVAVGNSGVHWISEALPMDGENEIDGVTDGRIYGTADPRSYEPTPFQLDMMTGQRMSDDR